MKKTIKSITAYIILLALILNLNVLFNNNSKEIFAADKVGAVDKVGTVYEVPIKALKAVNGAKSMVSEALTSIAKVTKTENGYDVDLTLQKTDIYSQPAHITHVFSYNSIEAWQNKEVPTAADIIETIEEEGIEKGKTRDFPRIARLKRISEKESPIVLELYVDLLDAMNVEGEITYDKITAGAKKHQAFLELDWEKAVATPPTTEVPEMDKVGDSRQIPVKLWHASQDQASMGNAALISPAKATKTATGYDIDISFKGLVIKPIKGHVTDIFSYSSKEAWENQEEPTPAEVLETMEDDDIFGGKSIFPKTVRLKRTGEKEAEIVVQVYVDAMDAIASGSATKPEDIVKGKGRQDAILVLDWGSVNGDPTPTTPTPTTPTTEPTTAPTEPVVNPTGNVIKDPALQAWLNAEIFMRRKKDTPILISELQESRMSSQIHIETTKYGEIKSLEGMQYAIKTGRFKIHNHPIKDISPLKSLPELQFVEVKNSAITPEALGALGDFPKLVELKLEGNNLPNLSGFSKRVKKIDDLILKNNKTTDITGLGNLESVGRLAISSNQLTSLNGLQKIKKIDKLIIGFNGLKNINAIKDIEKLQELRITESELKDEQFKILAELKSAKSLNLLYINSENLSDLSFLRGGNKFENLEDVELLNTRIQNFSELQDLEKIKYLTIKDNKNTIDVDTFKPIKNIKIVSIENSKVLNVEKFNELKKLEHLKIQNTEVEDVSKLDTRQLKALLAKKNKIKDISNFEFDLNKMERLDLQENEIADVSSLKDIQKKLKSYTAKYVMGVKVMNQRITITLENPKSSTETKIEVDNPLRDFEGNVVAIKENAWAKNKDEKIIIDLSQLPDGENANVDFVYSDIFNGKINFVVNIEEEVNVIKDPALQAFMNDRFFEGRDKETPILASELEGNLYLRQLQLTEDTKKYGIIKTLEGVEHLKSLTMLRIHGHAVEDFSPIENLNKIEKISIRDNKINEKSIEVIANLPELSRLILKNNNLSNLDAFKSRTQSFSKVELINNNIEDFSCFKNVESIGSLYIRENNTKKLKGIQDLKKVRILIIRGNGLEDIEGLQHINGIERLIIEEHGLQDKNFEILGELKSSETITSLWITNKNITNLSFLNGNNKLNQLSTLRLISTNVEDFKILENFTELSELHIENNKVTIDLKNLKVGSKINSITFIKTKLENIEELNAMKESLTILEMVNAGITDVSKLDVSNLVEFDVNNNQIENVSTLKFEAEELLRVDLSNNKIADVSNIKAVSEKLKSFDEVAYVNGLKLMNQNISIELKSVDKKDSVYEIENPLRDYDGNVVEIIENDWAKNKEGKIIIDSAKFPEDTKAEVGFNYNVLFNGKINFVKNDEPEPTTTEATTTEATTTATPEVTTTTTTATPEVTTTTTTTPEATTTTTATPEVTMTITTATPEVTTTTTTATPEVTTTTTTATPEVTTTTTTATPEVTTTTTTATPEVTTTTTTATPEVTTTTTASSVTTESTQPTTAATAPSTDEELILKDPATDIEIRAYKNVIPKAASIYVQKITAAESFEHAKKELQKTEKFDLYQIELRKDNQEVQPSGEITLIIPAVDADKVYVFNNEGKAQKVETVEFKDSKVYIKTNHLSLWAVATSSKEQLELNPTPPNTEPTILATAAGENPKGLVKTGETTRERYSTAIILLGLMSIAFIIRKKSFSKE